MKYTFIVFLSLCFSFNIFAEYRAYQYLVKSLNFNAITTDGSPQIITSTLNPVAFKSYHGGSMISIDMLKSWMCPGHTGYHKPTCSHPYERMQ